MEGGYWRRSHHHNQVADLHEIINRFGFNSRYIKYLIGASLVGCVSGLILPTTSVPGFDPFFYSQGGRLTSTALSETWVLIYSLVCRGIGWALMAGWADIIGRKRLVVMSLWVSCLFATTIAFLPGDVSMFVAVGLYQISSTGWEVNACLMQTEASQPLNVIIPFSLIDIASTVFSLAVWTLGWAFVSIRVDPNAAVSDMISDLHQRVTFLLCSCLLGMGYIFFRFIAFESPHYLILQKKQLAAWKALRKMYEEIGECDNNQTCVLTLQEMDVESHYLSKPQLKDRLILHLAELWKFIFTSEKLAEAESKALGTQEEDNITFLLPPTEALVDALPQEVLVTASEDAAKTNNDETMLRIISSEKIVTERFDDQGEGPEPQPRSLSLLLFLSMLTALALSINGWAGEFWANSLPNPLRDPRRLYTDFASIPGSLLAIFMTRFFPQSIFLQLQVSLYMLILFCGGVFATLQLNDDPSTWLRLTMAVGLASLAGAADSCVQGLFVVAVPISLRASFAALSRIGGLFLYLVAHTLRTSLNFDRQPAVWVAAYFAASLASENLLWPRLSSL